MKNKFIDSSRGKSLTEIRSFQDFIKSAINLSNTTIRNIDFRGIAIDWENLHFDHTTFIACHFRTEDELTIIEKGAMVFHEPKTLPFEVYRNKLYSYQELNDTIENKTRDLRIYEHFVNYRDIRNINESLYQRIHDHAIDEALLDLFESMQLSCVGFMGGHGVLRNSTEFWQAAELSWRVAKEGYFVVTGGGPGIMEAANMGAYFSAYELEDLHEAINKIADAPSYKDAEYEAFAQKVVQEYPEGKASLAIPTWFYGHEPSNAFSKYIAKYFSNAVREDTLLAICLHGIIYCPGSAGTIQEVFADAAQNHYKTYDKISPMIFFGEEYYSNKLPAVPLLRNLSNGKDYADYITITDDQLDVLEFLKNHPPA